MGNCYLKTEPKQPKKALEYFKNVENIDSNNSLAKFNIGLLFYSLGEYTDSINYLKEASNIDPMNVKIRFNLGMFIVHINIALAYEKSNELNKCLEEYKEILKIDSNNSDAIINMSIIATKLGDHKRCLDVLIKASENNPYDTRFYTSIANIFIKAENFKDAVVFLEKARNFDKNDLNILKRLMNVLLKLESYERLEKVCKDIIRLDKNNTKALSVLTKCFKKTGKMTELNKLLTKIQDKVNNINLGDEVKNLTGGFSHEQNEKVAESLSNLKQKINHKIIDIENYQVYNVEDIQNNDDLEDEQNGIQMEMGNEKIDQYYSPKELEELLAQLDLQPENQDVIYKLASGYYKMKDYEKAKEFLMRLNEGYRPNSVKEKLGNKTL